MNCTIRQYLSCTSRTSTKSPAAGELKGVLGSAGTRQFRSTRRHPSTDEAILYLARHLRITLRLVDYPFPSNLPLDQKKFLDTHKPEPFTDTNLSRNCNPLLVLT